MLCSSATRSSARGRACRRGEVGCCCVSEVGLGPSCLTWPSGGARSWQWLRQLVRVAEVDGYAGFLAVDAAAVSCKERHLQRELTGEVEEWRQRQLQVKLDALHVHDRRRGSYGLGGCLSSAGKKGGTDEASQQALLSNAEVALAARLLQTRRAKAADAARGRSEMAHQRPNAPIQWQQSIGWAQACLSYKW